MLNRFGTRLSIQVTPTPKKGGTPLAKLSGPKSRFAIAMEALKRNRRAVILFYVHPNSFNTYLLSRKIADKVGVPAGWEIRGGAPYRIQIKEVEVRRLEEPPPAVPNNKPRPLRLKPKLD